MVILPAMDPLSEHPRNEQAPLSGPDGLPSNATAAGSTLPLVIAAWIPVDPAVAARLIEEWLDTADSHGNLAPACPVVCQWTERLLAVLPDPEPFRERVLPRLARYLERIFDRLDEKGTGLPRWPSAEQALFPAEFAPGRFTVDLAVLLSNEASAFYRLAKNRKDLDTALAVAESEQRELDSWLRDSFWDEEASAFHRHDEGQQSVPDGSPCGYFPLVWGGRTEEMVEGLRGRAATWDMTAWSPRGWVLFFALLLLTSHTSVVARMQRAGLPRDASPAEAAAWAALSAHAEELRAQFLEDIPHAVRWLDVHGRTVARGLAAGATVLLLVLLGWWFIHREAPSGGDLGELERQAHRAGAEGQHARAAVLYGRAARRGHRLYYRYRQAGEWMRMGEYAAAEEAYREILGQEPDTPNARLNLALAVLGQGRRSEALDLYRAFAEEAAGGAELTARARLAAKLIEQQLALDRE